jgi:anti-anti-sigma factor
MTTLTQSNVEGTTLLKISGELSQTGVEAIREGLLRGAAGGGSVVVDLSAVPHINTPGIALFLAAHRELQRLGGRLLIAGAKGIVADVIRCCQLHRVLTLVDDPAEALRTARDGGRI